MFTVYLLCARRGWVWPRPYDHCNLPPLQQCRPMFAVSQIVQACYCLRAFAQARTLSPDFHLSFYLISFRPFLKATFWMRPFWDILPKIELPFLFPHSQASFVLYCHISIPDTTYILCIYFFYCLPPPWESLWGQGFLFTAIFLLPSAMPDILQELNK